MRKMTTNRFVPTLCGLEARALMHAAFPDCGFAPDVTVEAMYRDRPIRDAKRTFPPADEQIRVLNEAAQRYAARMKSCHQLLAGPLRWMTLREP